MAPRARGYLRFDFQIGWYEGNTSESFGAPSSMLVLPRDKKEPPGAKKFFGADVKIWLRTHREPIERAAVVAGRGEIELLREFRAGEATTENRQAHGSRCRTLPGRQCAWAQSRIGCQTFVWASLARNRSA
jgi:hypothetical protein